MELFVTNEKLSENSKKLYAHNLKKLNDGNPVKNLNYLKHFNVIDEKLDKLPPNTRRSYIIAIVSATKGQTPYQKVNSHYYEKMIAINKELRDKTDKTAKETENWLTQEQVEEKFEELHKIVGEIGNKKKITDTQYTSLLDCVILALYVLIAPRRNIDYCLMVVGKPDEDTSVNYFHKDKFYFNQYKTAGTYKQQVVSVPVRLQELLKFYSKFKSKEKQNLLVNYKGRPIITSSEMSRRLHKIFDAKVSSSMLRKIFLTNKYSDAVEELKEDAEEMGTSVSTIQTNYIKK
jgi:hypothetical protein